MAGDELVLPLHTASALREEVACRVARRRRRRARRRMVKAAVPTLALLAWLVAGDGISGVSTGIDTTGGRTDPAAEGTVAVGGAGPTGPSGRHERGPSSGGGASVAAGRPAPGEPASSALSASPPPATTRVGEEPPPPSPAAAAVRLVVARGSEGIWELRRDGTPVRRLVASGSDPALSPDGGRLAYTKRWDGLGDSRGVAVLDLDTMQSRLVLMASDADFSTPTWSPDGTQLAVTKAARTLHTPPTLDFSVVVADVTDGSRRMEFGPGEHPSWHSDGRILYRCGNRLCVRSTDGTTAEVPQSPEVFGAAWSPDGGWIAAWEQHSQALVVLRPDGSKRRTVVGRIAGVLAWSPDGAALVYPTNEGLRSVGLDGSDVRSLTDQASDTDPHLVAVHP